MQRIEDFSYLLAQKRRVKADCFPNKKSDIKIELLLLKFAFTE